MGELVSEGLGDENAIGASKFYRVEYFQQIGGFVREVMWDGIDGHRCRMLGWIAVSWDEPELRFVHLRPMGSSQQSIFVGRLRWGYGQYFMGTGPLYMMVSALFRMTKRPFVVGGLCMWWGYVRARLRRTPRYPDLEFRRFVRRFQWRCPVYGKRRATEMTNVEQADKFGGVKSYAPKRCRIRLAQNSSTSRKRVCRKVSCVHPVVMTHLLADSLAAEPVC